jgi:hypothetical protein
VDAEPHIRPLCASSSDEGISALLCDEDVPPAPITSVKRVLDPDYVFVSERQAGGGQGLGNPCAALPPAPPAPPPWPDARAVSGRHGEHGEECFDLRDCDVSEAVRIVVREGRDTERVL